MTLEVIDLRIIQFFKRISVPTARIGLFIVFFWFGILKVAGLSPAANIIQDLFNQTISFVNFQVFYVCFALFECLIGIFFLIKGMERVVLPLLFIHMITTFLPLFMLPDATWQGMFIPTLEGQYIIKNLVIIATAIGIISHLHPIRK